MEESHSFAPLLIVVLLAFIIPLLLARFKRLTLPIVVGEILVGILVGRSGFGWVSGQEPMLDLLAEFGFAFLMFQAGMEIDFSGLSLSKGGNDSKGRQRRGPLSLGFLYFLLTVASATAVSFGLLRFGLIKNPWMMGLILSTTSLGVVMPVLKEKDLISGRFGQTILIAALIADFATMLLITIVVAILSSGLTVNILLIGILFVVFFLVYRLGVFSMNRVPGVRRTLEELSHTTARIKIRGAFTVLLLFVVLSEVLGTEVILGAFLAGAMLSLLSTPDDAEMMHQLEAVGFGFFIPIFFIMVGVRFNLAVLLGSSQAMLLLPLLLLAAILVKLLPALVFRLGFSTRDAFAAGVLLSARLSLIIAASAIGLRLGIISEPVNAAVILVAIITVTVAPLVFVRFVPERKPSAPPPIVVVGAGERGLLVAEQLRSHQEWVVVLDADEARVARARQLGFEALVAEVGCDEPRAAPYLDAANTLVSTYTDTESNYRVCQLARTVYGIPHVVAMVTDPMEMHRFEQLGVRVVNPAIDQAAFLSLLARNPGVYDLLTRTDDSKEVREVVVRNRRYEDKPLRQLELPGDVLVLALRRDGEFVVPHGNTRVGTGDRLTLVGSLDCLETAYRMFAAQ
ncbi:MAG: cation:proton antiporter [Ardenticatenaceae bacterium]|nr:cation:proton antiporter [Ardenticatenaceae bacterium]HBY94162.1 hypothetical protein [Chloroflexota bacterium]